MKIYSWNEVIEFQRNGKEAAFIPNIKEKENTFYELKVIPLSQIPPEHFTPLDMYKDDDCWDDVEVIHALIDGYINNDKIPPIILDSTYRIIDGFHRISALQELERKDIEVFLECA